MNNTIPHEIQLLLTRELVIAEPSLPREVYKEEKTKLQNNTSRLDREDADGGKVSTRPAFGPEAVASQPSAVDSVFIPEEVKGESGNVISPRDITSRYSGISVQHAKTTKGVKIAITLQKPEWTTDGICQMATAELKRADRLREIKARPEDSVNFARYLENAKQQIIQSKDKLVCMGRLHQRGRRSQWLYDTLIIACFEGTKMQNVVLYIEGEEHLIEMNQELSENQQKFYLSQGRMGDIKSGVRIPRIDDLPLIKFGE